MNRSIAYDVVRRKPARAVIGKKGALLLGAAAALAVAASVVRWRTVQAEAANPPRGRFITVDGVQLHYVERGQGEPVVLLHGNGTMAQDYDLSGLVDLAAANYRVIAFDRPGYGHSEASPDTRPEEQARLLHHALQRLGIERPIIVGHSWGTLVALSLALDFPESVRSLVLLSGYYFPTPRMDVPLLSPPAIPIIGDFMRYTISPLIGRMIWPAMLKRLFWPAEVTPAFKRFPVWMALRPSQLRASAKETALMIPAAMRLRKRYGELTMPVVIMAGADDLHVSALWHSGRLHKKVPHSELHLTPGVGHMVHHLAPHEVMHAIDSAATSVGAAADAQHADRGAKHVH